MKLKCIGNSLADLVDSVEKAAYAEYAHLDQVDLEVGCEYTAFGVAFHGRNGLPWFLVCEDEDDDYPSLHLGAFFEIVDGSIPSDWVLTQQKNNVGDMSFLPDRWSRDPCFLEKLVDGDSDAIAYFKSLKA